jgi:hypothetical protein
LEHLLQRFHESAAKESGDPNVFAGTVAKPPPSLNRAPAITRTKARSRHLVAACKLPAGIVQKPLSDPDSL